MLKRKILADLMAWKENKHQECLLVKGARQIGKTFIIEYFGKNYYENYVYINFVERPEFKNVFEGSLSAAEIYERITLLLPKVRFVPGKTLIFLDEIQICPSARTALKFLALDDCYDVVASGSLLGINYGEIESVPVGYERQITMFSLDFREFLWAIGYDDTKIFSLKKYFDNREKVPTAVNDVMLNYLRQYMAVGGMPAVVNDFIVNHHYGRVQELQEKILASYGDDVEKYADLRDKPKIRSCYYSVSRQLAKENKKFQFSLLENKATARKYGDAVQWLQDANLVELCYNVSAPEFPLPAYIKEGFYKVYLEDVGLLVAMYGFEMKEALVTDILKGPAKGGIYENLVADILVKNGHKLCYYRSASGDLEMEFLLNDGAKIIPVEVKAKRGATASLDKLLMLNEIPYGYKLTAGNVGISGKKITLPLYMAMFF